MDTGKRVVESQYDVADVVSVFRHYGRVAAKERPARRQGNTDVGADVHEPPRRMRADRAVELPAAPGELEGRAVPGRGQHLRAQAQRADAAHDIDLMGCSRRRGCRPASATWCSAPDPRRAWLAEDPRCDLVSLHRRPADRPPSHGRGRETVKKAALEPGGKNPNIVFADADLEVALDYALTAVFLHSGQVCSAGARLLVRGRDPRLLRRRAGRPPRRDPVGGPHDAKAETGPLISAAHRDKVAAYVATGIAEGAVLRCGGAAPDDPELQNGYYYLPTCSTAPPARCR